MKNDSFFSGIVLPAAIVIAGLAAVIWLSGMLEQNRPQLPENYGDTDLTMNGSRLKGFAFGTEGLIADWYFMRSLQYIGNKMISSKSETINIDDLRDLNPRLLYPLLDNATDLDPNFIAAYSYGAMVLPAIDKEKAIELIKKGIARNTDSWRLYQHLAYIYWKLKRYDEAAEIYERGSQIADAQPFMKLMAASMKADGGSRETARSIYRQMLDSSDDEQVRITASHRLQELDSMDERDAIDKALVEFKDRNGRCATGFSEILPELSRVKLPAGNGFEVDRSNRLMDPTGAPYLLDKDKCKSALDLEHTSLPNPAK
ncbi:MAG TPA: hypothetical protein VHQ01_05890 [Pyrinomonadaceae bacterium]|nr:hypothetical protein [Pyrinomonadaceae bacterium]